MSPLRDLPFWKRTLALVLFFYLGGLGVILAHSWQFNHFWSPISYSEWILFMVRLIGLSLTFALVIPVGLAWLSRRVLETDRFILVLLSSSVLGCEAANRAYLFWQTTFYGPMNC